MPIVREGVLAGFLSSRETAAEIGLERSGGCMRADGFARQPIVRMTNVNLEPGAAGTLDGPDRRHRRRACCSETNRSWSIDNRRLQFQFGGEAAREIRDGELGAAAAQPELRRRHAAVLGELRRRLLGVRLAPGLPARLRQGRARAGDARVARIGAGALSRRGGGRGVNAPELAEAALAPCPWRGDRARGARALADAALRRRAAHPVHRRGRRDRRAGRAARRARGARQHQPQRPRGAGRLRAAGHGCRRGGDDGRSGRPPRARRRRGAGCAARERLRRRHRGARPRRRRGAARRGLRGRAARRARGARRLDAGRAGARGGRPRGEPFRAHHRRLHEGDLHRPGERAQRLCGAQRRGGRAARRRGAGRARGGEGECPERAGGARRRPLPVVFEPYALGELLDLLAASALNGLAHVEGRGALDGRLGQRWRPPRSTWPTPRATT